MPPKKLMKSPWTILLAASLPLAACTTTTTQSFNVSKNPNIEAAYIATDADFSFVTMTTLGYGDLLPISATARAMAYMQAVFGQFYIAILVAGLVGVYISRER